MMVSQVREERNINNYKGNTTGLLQITINYNEKVYISQKSPKYDRDSERVLLEKWCQ